MIERAWERARGFAVPADFPEARYVEVDSDCPLTRVAQPVLRSAVDRMSGIAVVGMLADRNGLLLSHSCGERSFERQLMDSGPITPGFDFSEISMGTNGIGTALAIEHPILIDGGEHYAAGGKSYSCGAAPVRGPDSDEVVGVVNFTCPARDSSPLLLAMASSVAAQTERELMIADRAGLAISSCSDDPTALRALMLAERRRHALRRRLHRAALLAATTDLRNLLSQVMSVAAQMLPIEAAWVLRSQESGALRVVGTWGDVPADALGASVAAEVTESLLHAAGARSTGGQAPRGSSAGRLWMLPGRLGPAGTKLVAAIAPSRPGPPPQPEAAGSSERTAPTALQPGRCVVVATLGASLEAETRDLLTEIATACDNASRFEEIRRQAASDALTGLPNRRRFMELARERFTRAQRDGRPMAVLMADIDRFKQVNDAFGHATGDRVLIAVAAAIRSALRGGDLVGRIGGEEIAVVAGADALDLAERIRRAVARTDLRTARGPLHVTVSVGAALQTADDEALGDLLDRADRALYAAKSAGRNRVVAS
ncbi:GGDEF domain-containing protein [Frankia sp. EI5c]|uniref:GGDEF domain-containing protein n=1 Tax=Frankia sp. EI5c TaxID=683316 RepID=UPI000824A82B|nr:GGDEF domain-containing protein [Frankia sp. EI5c]